MLETLDAFLQQRARVTNIDNPEKVFFRPIESLVHRFAIRCPFCERKTDGVDGFTKTFHVVIYIS